MIEKIDDVTIRETIVQPDLVVTKTLDQYLADKVNLVQGILNNQKQITFLQEKIDEIDTKIEEIKGLGVKTQVEVNAILAEEARLEAERIANLPPEPLPVDEVIP